MCVCGGGVLLVLLVQNGIWGSSIQLCTERTSTSDKLPVACAVDQLIAYLSPGIMLPDWSKARAHILSGMIDNNLARNIPL